MKLTSLFVATVLLGGALYAHAESCTRVVQRKEIRQLSSQERNAFIQAIKKMMSGKSPTAYDRFTDYHTTFRLEAHGTALFFPWHRSMLRAFERELQRINPNLALPYWDWSIDSQAPDESPIWGPDWFGGNGQGSNGCVTNGPFSDWKPIYPESHCLQRVWDNKGKMSALYGPEFVNRLIQTNTQYDSFRDQVENSVHNQVHVAVGGDMALQTVSPNDPVFYLHHAMVDRIWSLWQKTQASRAKELNGLLANGRSIQASTKLTPFQEASSDVLDTRNLCYTYDELTQGDLGLPQLPPPQTNATSTNHTNATVIVPITSTNITNTNTTNGTNGAIPIVTKPVNTTTNTTAVTDTNTTIATTNTTLPPNKVVPDNVTVVTLPPNDSSKATNPSYDDRSNLVSIRPVKPLPAEWLARFGYNVAKVRRIEADYANVCDKLNKLKGYVSPCALWNRGDILGRLVTKVDRFTANINGKSIIIGNNKKANPLQIVANIKAKVSVTTGTTEIAKSGQQVSPALRTIIGPPVIQNTNAVSNVYSIQPRNLPPQYLPGVPTDPVESKVPGETCATKILKHK